MSQLNISALNEPENMLHRAKQYGTSEITQSTMKKTALADVKNILAQRTVHSAKKPTISASKTDATKKNLFAVFNDKENDNCRKEMKKDVDLSSAPETCTTSHCDIKSQADSEINEGYVHPVCSFCHNVEDDEADTMLKSITLTKTEIDRLALEWERKVVVGLDDMRMMETPAAIPDEIPPTNWAGFDHEYCEPNLSLLNDIPAIESLFDDVLFEE